MPKFRKKPIIVEAEQFTEANTPHGIQFFVTESGIYTFGNFTRCNHGDWIVTGIKGEKYAVKDEIFKELYERITE